MTGTDRITEEHARELKRLCDAYDEAAAGADVGLARQLRASISDFVAEVASDDPDLEAELRRELCFPVAPSPNTLDQ